MLLLLNSIIKLKNGFIHYLFLYFACGEMDVSLSYTLHVSCLMAARLIGNKINERMRLKWHPGAFSEDLW